MDALILVIFLLNNLFWMAFMYILVPVARQNSDNNKKEIDLSFPFTKKRDNINTDLPPQYDEVGEVSLEDVAASFGEKAKQAKKK
jgi:hypothetical protein